MFTLLRPRRARAIFVAHPTASSVSNGDLLAVAEKAFDLFITTDQNLRYQQNLAGRRLAILVLPTTSWPEIQTHLSAVVEAVNATQPGGFVELVFKRTTLG